MTETVCQGGQNQCIAVNVNADGLCPVHEIDITYMPVTLPECSCCLKLLIETEFLEVENGELQEKNDELEYRVEELEDLLQDAVPGVCF